MKSSFNKPELDVLRFGAFMGVFICHAFPNFPWEYTGWSPVAAQVTANAVRCCQNGVTLFFVLSSYLITSLLIREYDQTGRLNVISFYIRRALRIWPLYFAFLAICYFVQPYTGWGTLPRVQWLGFGTFTANWVMAFKGMPATPAVPLWSVSVEEQFYLVWPLLILAFGVARIRAMALVGIVAAQVIRIAMLAYGATMAQFWLSTFSQIDAISAGALIAVTWRNTPPLSAKSGWLSIATGMALVFLAQLMVDPAIRGAAPWQEVARFPLTVLGCALILIGAIGRTVPPAASFITYLGKISFGLYVYHFGIHALVAHYLPGFAGVVASLALTIIVSAASYAWLEKPFLVLKDRFAVVHSRRV